MHSSVKRRSLSEAVAQILPLYQTVLVSMQSLRADAKILETLGSLLAAPFYGRKDRHAGAAEAFSEFWQATYAEVPEPSTGYSEPILQCLDAVAQARLEEQEDEAKVEDMTEIRNDLDSPVSEWSAPAVTKDAGASDAVDESYESEDEGSVIVPSPGTLSRMSIPTLKPVIFSPVTSPEIARVAPSSPKASPRRHVSSPSHSRELDVVESSPARVPTTPKRSPGKAHASKNKENASPLPMLSSVTERLAARSPLLLESILGKRSRNEDSEELAALGEKILKRGRLETSPLAPSAFTNVQVHMVIHDGVKASEELSPELEKPVDEDASSGSSDTQFESAPLETTPTPASRKRKGVFLEAVEVPSVNAVSRTRRRPGLKPGPSTEVGDAPATEEAPQPILRRTRSATKLLGKQADFQRLDTPKRRRMNRARELREEAAQMSSPLRSIRDAPLFGSGE